MTETEWRTGTDPVPMLRAARGKKVRKCRLVAVAWVRSLGPLLPHESSRRAADAAELFADGRTAPEELARRADDAYGAYAALRDAHGTYDWRTVAAFVALMSAWNPDHSGPVDTLQRTARALADARTRNRLRAASALPVLAGSAPHAAVVRDVFANPFRPATFSPSWATDTARTLARQMYDAREFSAMPILADALQDAGCDNTDLLDHCRDTSLAHVRGCWAVDLVLGRE